MKIYTSYFSNVRNLPNNIIPIAICGKIKFSWQYPTYKKLAPRWSFFSKWLENKDNEYYREHFFKEVLEPLNPDQVVKELEKISGGKDVALICYESPEKFCHRHLVAEWLSKKNYAVEEWSNN